MLAATSLLLISIFVTSSAEAIAPAPHAGAASCSFVDAGAAPPGPADDGAALTCAPAAAVGPGSVTIELNAEAAGAYIDVKAFFYSLNASDKVARSPAAAAVSSRSGGGRAELPGQVVRVALLATGFDGATNLSRSVDYIAASASAGADLAVLPEFFDGDPHELANGTGLATVAAAAAAANMWLIASVHELDAASNKTYNTAVLFNREGRAVGSYRKSFPVYGNISGGGAESGVVPSLDGVGVFALDDPVFGALRLCILICFDRNFAELWLQCQAHGAQLVVWPTAMSTPDPVIHGFGAALKFYVACVGYPGEFVDIDGGTVNATLPRPVDFPQLSLADVDIDRTWVAWDNNVATGRISALMAAHNDSLTIDSQPPRSPSYLFRATRPGVRVRPLLREFGIEEELAYVTRSRRVINEFRQNGTAMP